jgi:recombination protein RecA
MSDLKDIISNIENRFGKESIASNKVEVERVSSGSIHLDLALGGGYPKGRIIELMGWESSGKSSLALHLAAEVQKLGKKVAYIDVEQALDLFYAEKLGVDVDIEAKDPNFFLSQPDSGEDAIEIAREFAKSSEIGLVVIDSVSALIPRAVLQGEAGDQKMGLVARLMSQWTPTLLSVAKRSGCIIVYISQYREKIGIVYGSNVTTTGGNALKFYASQRIEVARAGQNKNGDEVISNKTKCKVVKNKVSSPFKIAEFNIVFGEGIDKLAEIIDIAVELDIIKKSGSWYSYDETKLGQGAENVKTILKDNPESFEEIEEKVNKELNL